MSDAFVGEIRIFGGNFAPAGWAFCNGQLLAVSQNSALFSLIGTTYGGDGKTTFALPNLQGRVPMQAGAGPGLTHRPQGSVEGSPTVTLLSSEMPAHTHVPMSVDQPGNTNDPTGAVWAQSIPQGKIRKTQAPLYGPFGNTVNMNVGALSVSGGGQPHNNMQPYLALSFIICLEGIFPPRG